MHVKTTKVTNPKNVLVQIPGFIIEKWALDTNDGVEVHISDDEQTVQIKPRKRYVQIHVGGRPDEESEGLARPTDGCQV